MAIFLSIAVSMRNIKYNIISGRIIIKLTVSFYLGNLSNKVAVKFYTRNR